MRVKVAFEPCLLFMMTTHYVDTPYSSNECRSLLTRIK